MFCKFGSVEANRPVEVEAKLKNKANLAFCEGQRVAAEFLKSGKEYKYWTLRQVTHLSIAGELEKLRSLFNFLLGPVHSSSSSWDPMVLGVRKRTILTEALDIVAPNPHMQRLHAEFKEQLSQKDGMKELDALF